VGTPNKIKGLRKATLTISGRTQLRTQKNPQSSHLWGFFHSAWTFWNSNTCAGPFRPSSSAPLVASNPMGNAWPSRWRGVKTTYWPASLILSDRDVHDRRTFEPLV